MDKRTLAGLMQVTQLTRAGRLAEATALIQRSLAGGSTGPAPFKGTSVDSGPASEVVIEGEWSEVIAPTHSEQIERSVGPASSVESRPGLKDAIRKWRRGQVDDEPRTPARADTRQPSNWIAGIYQNAAGQRAYKLYVPSSYTGQSLPLIVMLHGCNQTPDDFAAGTQMHALGEEQSCFVLYPAQSNTANHSRCWNWFRREDQVRDRGEPSMIAGMTREIVDRYGIDSRKVYVAGLSAGGAMAAVMGVAYPDLYAAVGVHSGLACGSAHDLPSALAAMKGMPVSNGRPSVVAGASPSIPTIVFHGDHDKTVHPRNGAEVISKSAHREGDHGGQVSTERGRAPDGHCYTRTVHRDAAGRVVLEHWLVHGGGHAWFGGSRAGSYSDPRGPNAAAEMLRFFRQTSGTQAGR
jgi:poly(hydroxyalkanoate) depolymerase family esterase